MQDKPASQASELRRRDRAASPGVCQNSRKGEDQVRPNDTQKAASSEATQAEKTQKTQTDDSKLTNTRETAFNASSALVGGGLLGVPFAFGQAGAMTSCLLLFVTLLCGWTSVLIGRLMEEIRPLAKKMDIEESAHDWPFIGYAAFGENGRRLCNLVFVAELWFTLLAYLVLNGVNLNIISHGVISNQMGVLATASVSFFLLFLSPKALSYLSAFGILSTVIAVGCLVWSALAMRTWATEFTLLNSSSIPVAMGTIQFCFVAHAAFPSMYRSMARPAQDYRYAMTYAFCFAGIFYLSLGLFAYKVYGSNAQPNFMANLGRELDLAPIQGLSFLYIAATSCFWINVQSSFPLFAAGLIAAAEGSLGIVGASALVRSVWKLAFIVLSTGVAFALRDCLDNIVSLVGCLCGSCTCLIFPMLFTWKLSSPGRKERAVMLVGLGYSFYILVSGTRDNVQQILNKIS
eukprot:TRINITY_DN48781_c0_g1_i1.p1 TRINITY_DN48781_c0_g1~~TRINITY_DN48781_c0_g1_i1.p1  ORF type:complete len:461 (-),score=60.76 TRINITY_DN48781_c0_g1_i1:72-1454(-)